MSEWVTTEAEVVSSNPVEYPHIKISDLIFKKNQHPVWSLQSSKLYLILDETEASSIPWQSYCDTDLALEYPTLNEVKQDTSVVYSSFPLQLPTHLGSFHF